MSITRSIPKVLNSPVGFGVSLAFCWGGVLALSVFLKGTQPASYIAIGFWLFLTAGTTTLWLRLFDYFISLQPIPNRSDLILLVLLLPWPAIFSKYWTYVFFYSAIEQYRWFLMATPFVAIGTFALQTLWGFTGKKAGLKKRLGMSLLLQEKEALLKTLMRYQLNDNVELLPPEAQCDIFVMSRGATQSFQKNINLLTHHINGIPVIDFKALMARITRRIAVDHTDLWSFLIEAQTQSLFTRLTQWSKNVHEPIIAFILLVLLFPVLLVVALLVLISGPGPILFKQCRTGQHGVDFFLYKFRTMCVDAEQQGVQWALENDPRITKIGNFLRKTHLDELPQLWNILIGDLSFVGPRPERPEFYEQLKAEIPLFSLRILVRPGVTGWAQVTGGYAASVQDSKRKLEYDLYYIKNLSFKLDILIISKTLGLFLYGKDKKSR